MDRRPPSSATTRPRVARAATLLLLFLGLGGLASTSGCSRRIGGACKLSIDCSLRGERVCDLSYVVNDDGFEDANGRGECIIEGCTADACPNEAVCVQVYSAQFLSVACDPETEDRPGGGDDCDPNEICLPEGVCADSNTARTTCRRRCRSDSTCRDGYSCRETGRRGVYVTPDPEDPGGAEETKICMPSPF